MSDKQTLASLTALVQGISSKLDDLAKEQTENFVILVRRLNAVEGRLIGVEVEVQQIKSMQHKHTELLNHLIKEVGALKNTD